MYRRKPRFLEEIKKYNLGAPGGVMSKTNLIKFYLKVAEIQMKLRDWKAALET
jgi:hypothetical protein